MKLILVVGILCGVNANAGSVTESFESNSRKLASTLVWNIGLGRLHPTMVISNAVTNTAVTFDYDLDFGDGRHGAFDSTTYQNFDSNLTTATIVELDTDVYFPLQVTNFRLPAGITIRPTGSNPLVIRSLQDAIIEPAAGLLPAGVIDCSGENGDPTRQPNTLTSSGGTGHCGGGRGGDGGRHTGIVPVAAERGYPQVFGTNAEGGAPGVAEAGGGGGGSLYNNSPAGSGFDNAGGAGGGGAAGLNFDDQQFTQILGSAGGGGGGVASGTAADSTGSGGGAGGGAVFIFAYQDIANWGTINVRGGNGGIDTGAATLGGLGGGGGGGTVVLIAGRDYSNDGPVLSNPGTGGTRAGNIGQGGDGAEARAWYTDSDGTLGGLTAEEKGNILATYSETDYTVGTLEATTTTIDLANTRPSIDSIVVTSTAAAGATITTSVAGSSDAFAGDDTGWLPISSLSSISKKRYIKFRFQILNTLPANTLPADHSFIDAVTVNFSETTQNDFTFGAACGHISNTGGPTIWKFLFELLAMLLPYLLVRFYQFASQIYHQLKPKISFGRT
jgi:hypothetical protein